MQMDFKDVCTNLRQYDNRSFKKYPLSDIEVAAILSMQEEAERLLKIRDLVSEVDYKERNDEIVDYYGFYEAVKEIVG